MQPLPDAKNPSPTTTVLLPSHRHDAYRSFYRCLLRPNDKIENFANHRTVAGTAVIMSEFASVAIEICHVRETQK